jgi:hypothetical protein
MRKLACPYREIESITFVFSAMFFSLRRALPVQANSGSDLVVLLEQLFD